MKIGKYKHSKTGNLYEVIGLAHHSEDLSEMVVYKSLYFSEKFGENALWVRPKEMFEEVIDLNGQKVPRFVYQEN